MAGWLRFEVHKITQMRDDAIYRTKQIKSVWLPINPNRDDQAIAKEYGGDILVSTMDSHFGPTKPTK
mgnify:CR=1 FL=1|jgi:hypothetical protein